MNDNKKWSKRAGVLFWWSLASFPFITLICYLIGNIVASNQTGSFELALTTNQVIIFCNYMNLITMKSINNAFIDLFNLLNIDVLLEGSLINPLVFILSWFIQTWLLHIVVDFILMLPKIAQKLIDKVCD